MAKTPSPPPPPLMDVRLEHLLLFLFAAFLVYHFFLKRCLYCGKPRGQCCCNKEGFTPLDTIHTSLDESINNPSCCISNTAGYSNDPFPVSEAAPGFSTISAYANPCN